MATVEMLQMLLVEVAVRFDILEELFSVFDAEGEHPDRSLLQKNIREDFQLYKGHQRKSNSDTLHKRYLHDFERGKESLAFPGYS